MSSFCWRSERKYIPWSRNQNKNEVCLNFIFYKRDISLKVEANSLTTLRNWNAGLGIRFEKRSFFSTDRKFMDTPECRKNRNFAWPIRILGVGVQRARTNPVLFWFFFFMLFGVRACWRSGYWGKTCAYLVHKAWFRIEFPKKLLRKIEPNDLKVIPQMRKRFETQLLSLTPKPLLFFF